MCFTCTNVETLIFTCINSEEGESRTCFCTVDDLIPIIYILISYRNKDNPCVGINYEKKRMESRHFHINLIL